MPGNKLRSHGRRARRVGTSPGFLFVAMYEKNTLNSASLQMRHICRAQTAINGHAERPRTSEYKHTLLSIKILTLLPTKNFALVCRKCNTAIISKVAMVSFLPFANFCNPNGKVFPHQKHFSVGFDFDFGSRITYPSVGSVSGSHAESV